MSNNLDLQRLAAFIESGQGEVHIHSEELKAALDSGTLSAAFTNGPYVWHQHPQPICAGSFDHPSCKGWGPDAMCVIGWSANGICD